MVKWTAAVIAGGGIAGLTQGATAALRAHSTVLTGGLGNPIIATVETRRRAPDVIPSPYGTGCRNRVGRSVFMAGDTFASSGFPESALEE
jgi:hypothetical protein